jgi:hypothetical protein
VLALTPVMLLALQAIATRLLPASRSAVFPQRLALACAAVGSVPTGLAVHVSSPPGAGAATWVYACIVYGCLAYSYFHLVNMCQTARRIHILCQIFESGPLTVEDVRARYTEDQVIAHRLRRLVASGQIREKNGRLCIRSGVLLAAARFTILWRELLGMSGDEPRGPGGRVEGHHQRP